jgi:hypothetical protein
LSKNINPKKLTGNPDVVIGSLVPQVSETQNGIVILLLPLLRVALQQLPVLLLFSKTRVEITFSTGVLELSLSLSRSENDLVVLLERSLEDLSSGRADERRTGGVDG